MTERQKMQITEMRQSGAPYSKITDILDISQSAVKSYCLRHEIKPVDKTAGREVTLCENCGAEIIQNLKGKHKRFCCDKCRNAWWNARPGLVNRKAVYEYTCRYCGVNFTAYGNARRKYCSNACYISARFGGGAND